MIDKNVKYGNIYNVTVIDLGNGDVKVSDTTHLEEKTGVVFWNDTPKPIGETDDSAGKTTDETGIDVIIHFTKVESIEVVERALLRAKSKLKEIISQKQSES